jgi:hypothetical protein
LIIKGFLTLSGYDAIIPINMGRMKGMAMAAYSKTDNKSESLQDIMNRMAVRVDDLLAAPTQKSVLSEAEAFATIDPLMNELLKQHKEAVTRRDELLKIYGANDAMYEISVDLADSCESVLQTRLIECREDDFLLAQMQEKHAKAAEQEARIERHEEKLELKYQRDRRDLYNKRKEKAKADATMWMWFFIYMMQMAMLETTKALSVMNDFEKVSFAQDDRKYATA